MDHRPITPKPTPAAFKAAGKLFFPFLLLCISYFLIEAFAVLLLKPAEYTALAFGGLWALLLTSVVLFLPRKAGRILYGITYSVFALWGIAQAGYYMVFGKMMWLSTISFADEGAGYLGDILRTFPPLWWIGGIIIIALGIILTRFFPKTQPRIGKRLPCLALAAISVAGLFLLPEAIFLKDKDIWGTRSEYARSSSYRVRYETMYDAKSVYDICGVFQLTAKDIWQHEIFPLTPAYQAVRREESAQIDEYFQSRGDSQINDMTGIFAGKNVVLVLMESMDDWMITPEDTPTLTRMMAEGIQFENFYTPGFGSARTINSEFCMNTGIYLPTTGNYVFDYVTNSFDQSIASQMTANGYSSEVFHYNDPSFYSRGVFEPAMGYNTYNCYADYETNEDKLYDDCLLFDIPQLNEKFFRNGPTFNTIITRSAHLSYVYNELLSIYALKQYPQYRGMYGSQEEDCARVKAKLVDDMFARLLQELENQGQLENTVIIGMTDHYTYGYKNMEELFSHSGVDHELLLEKTPCFIWSADGPALNVTKTLNTADLLPTVLNLMGIDSPYNYLGQDAFDPNYAGYVVFPDGSWATGGIVCQIDTDGYPLILANETGEPVPQDLYKQMGVAAQEFIHISNLLLTSDYYSSIRQ